MEFSDEDPNETVKSDQDNEINEINENEDNVPTETVESDQDNEINETEDNESGWSDCRIIEEES